MTDEGWARYRRIRAYDNLRFASGLAWAIKIERAGRAVWCTQGNAYWIDEVHHHPDLTEGEVREHLGDVAWAEMQAAQARDRRIWQATAFLS